MAYNFLGGVIKNASSLSAFFNPTINSYRRINAPPTKSGASWSPSSISYTGNNRTHMIRIPDPGRFELRLMDGSANPYLLQASILAAGLDGLKNPDKYSAFFMTPPKKLYAVLLNPRLSELSKNIFFFPFQTEICAWHPLPVKYSNGFGMKGALNPCFSDKVLTMNLKKACLSAVIKQLE